MKRSFYIAAAGLLWSGFVATNFGWIDGYRLRNYHESLSNQICTAISSRAQVGANRDAFDQAYSILRISSRAEKSYLSLKDGAAEYGQRPANPSQYQAAGCQVEGRPDLNLTFFFEKAPIFGKTWLLSFLITALLSVLLGLALHILSSRLVAVAQKHLSDGMDFVFENKKIGSPRLGLKKAIEVLLENAPAIRNLKIELEEKARLARENSTFRSKVSGLLESNSKYEAQEKTTAEVVSQVRHDLRSPLSFLKVFGQTLEKSGDVETFHLSVQKIDRILQDLNQVAGAEIRSAGTGDRCLVECALQDAVSAKKLVWKTTVDVSLEFDRQALNLSPIDSARFGRILDNLLQNAFDAIESSGKIKCQVRRLDKRVELKITDNGKGIPEEVLRRLGSERITFGKAGGNGIGLRAAKQWLEAWGGSLSIQSTLGKGTAVSIVIPRIETAAHFVAGLVVTQNQEVVVVDDEKDTAEQLIERSGGRGKHFASIATYAAWLDGIDLSNDMLLSVYDLHLKPGSGLDLLRLHPWPKRAILYTSDYLNPDAIELSGELGFPILPKTFLTV